MDLLPAKLRLLFFSVRFHLLHMTAHSSLHFLVPLETSGPDKRQRAGFGDWLLWIFFINCLQVWQARYSDLYIQEHQHVLLGICHKKKLHFAGKIVEGCQLFNFLSCDGYLEPCFAIVFYTVLLRSEIYLYFQLTVRGDNPYQASYPIRIILNRNIKLKLRENISFQTKRPLSTGIFSSLFAFTN